MKVATRREDFPEDKLQDFVSALDGEKRYFLMTLDEILASPILVYEEVDGGLAGIAGVRYPAGTLGKLFRIPLSYMVVLERFQSKGIGSRLLFERHEALRQHYHYYMGTFRADNQKVVNLNRKLKGRILGQIGDRLYWFRPLNPLGMAIYYLAKIAFLGFFAYRHLRERIES